MEAQWNFSRRLGFCVVARTRVPFACSLAAVRSTSLVVALVVGLVVVLVSSIWLANVASRKRKRKRRTTWTTTRMTMMTRRSSI